MMATAPRLTILLPAMFGLETVEAAIDAWKSQGELEQLEVLVLLPGQASAGTEPSRGLPDSFTAVWVGDAGLHEARSMGVARARGDYVFFAEDHCLPDPGWAGAMLRRMDGAWDVINPAIRPGSLGSRWGTGSFLLAYGQWMPPIRAAPIDVICGANLCIRTERLRSFGEELSHNLQFGAFLVRTLARQGCRAYLESDAQMRHFDNILAYRSLREMMYVGMAFGAFRTETWPVLARASYPCACPLLALVHLRRAFAQFLRAGRARGISASALLAATCQASMWAIGEGFGAWMGRRRVVPYLWIAELKPASRAAVARCNALEAQLSIHSA